MLSVLPIVFVLLYHLLLILTITVFCSPKNRYIAGFYRVFNERRKIFTAKNLIPSLSGKINHYLCAVSMVQIKSFLQHSLHCILLKLYNLGRPRTRRPKRDFYISLLFPVFFLFKFKILIAHFPLPSALKLILNQIKIIHKFIYSKPNSNQQRYSQYS